MVRDYRRLPVPVLAGRLGRSVVSLYQKARVLGLMTPGRSRTDPRLDAKVKRFSGRGLSDAEVAKEIGCERHAVSDARKRLGLPAQTYSEHRREMVRRKTREQCRAAGVRNLAEVRVLAWRRRAAGSGWPADLQPRAIQILDALSARGPMTRREVAAAIAGEFGLSWRPGESPASSSDRGGGAGAGQGSDVSGEVLEQMRTTNVVLKGLDGQLSDAAVRLVELSAERDKARAERDALMNLIVQPWARDGDGAQLWKVNLAWWETATSREEGVAMVRKAAGLEAKP
jgi:hypothetical protein